LHTPNALEKLRKCSKAKLLAIKNNPLDNSWTNRPNTPSSKIKIHPVEFSGEPHHHKCTRIAKLISKKNADIALITSPAFNCMVAQYKRIRCDVHTINTFNCYN
jgi:Xaa-Pro aminopeptidase